MTQASDAIENYHNKLKLGRTRFQPTKEAVREVDPKLPTTRFYRYPDGSSIRLDFKGDAVEF